MMGPFAAMAEAVRKADAARERYEGVVEKSRQYFGATVAVSKDGKRIAKGILGSLLIKPQGGRMTIWRDKSNELKDIQIPLHNDLDIKLVKQRTYT